MITLNSQPFTYSNQSNEIKAEIEENHCISFHSHKQWNHKGGWKNTLNNIRLIIQPMFIFWMIYPWLEVFPSSNLFLGFNDLIAAINQSKFFYSSG